MPTSRNYRLHYQILGLLLFVVAFFSPFIFETNDDNMMMMLVSGAFSGIPEPHGVFIHSLLALVLSSLYQVTNLIPWYPLGWFICLLMAYAAWVEMVCRKIKSTANQIVFVLALLSFLLQTLFYLQFTVVAGILAFAGCGLLLLQFEEKSSSTFWDIYGCLLCLLSLMVRKESFFLFTAGFGLLFLIKYGWGEVGAVLRRRKWLVVWVVLLLLFTPYYEKLNGYESYVAFNTARSKVLDHPVLLYQPTDAEVSPDLYYAQNWYFRNNPAVTVATFYNWKEQLDKGLFEINHIQQSINFYWLEMNNNKYISFLGLLFLIILALGGGRKREKLLFLWAWLMVVVLLNHFYLVHARVQTLIFLMLLGAAFFLYENLRPIKGSFLILLSGLFVLAVVVHAPNIKKGMEARKNTIESYRELEDLVPQSEVFFLDWRSWNVKHLNPKKIKEHDNRLLSLGWQTYHPADYRVFHQRGFDRLQDIPSFYYLRSVEEEKPLLPGYMNYLQDAPYKPTVIARNHLFELLYYK